MARYAAIFSNLVPVPAKTVLPGAGYLSRIVLGPFWAKKDRANFGS